MYVIIRKINLKLICQSNNFIGSEKKNYEKKTHNDEEYGKNNTQPMRVSSVHTGIAMAQLTGSVMSCYC